MVKATKGKGVKPEPRRMGLLSLGKGGNKISMWRGDWELIVAPQKRGKVKMGKPEAWWVLDARGAMRENPRNMACCGRCQNPRGKGTRTAIG